MNVLIYDDDLKTLNNIRKRVIELFNNKNISYEINSIIKEDDFRLVDLKKYNFLFINVVNQKHLNFIKEYNFFGIAILYSDNIEIIQNGMKNGFFCFFTKTVFLNDLENILIGLMNHIKMKAIFISYKGIYYILYYSDIYSIKSDGNYIDFYMEKDIIKARASIQKYHFYEYLDYFIKVDKGRIVNAKKVLKFDLHKQMIIMKNYSIIYCSLKGVRNLKKFFNMQLSDNFV